MSRTFVIRGVRVLAGGGLSAPRDVAVVDGRIAHDAAPGAREVDGHDRALLPGLIDTHVHVTTRQQLAAYGRWGVTTALDMGTADWPATAALRGQPGVTDLRSAGGVACAPRGTAVRAMGYPASSAVAGPQDAARFVAERVAEGADHVKIVMDERLPLRPRPLDADTVRALVSEAHRAGLQVCVHATSVASFRVAAAARADVLTHVPLAAPLGDPDARALAARGTAVTPTLTMMKKLVERFPLPIKPRAITYENAARSVVALHRAGVTILAGTDANSDPAAPNTIEHGAALHEELRLLVDAGLTPTQALDAASRAAAQAFGLEDRGRIQAGLRADLLLVEGDPTADILATQRIRAVWIAGEEVR